MDDLEPTAKLDKTKRAARVVHVVQNGTDFRHQQKQSDQSLNGTSRPIVHKYLRVMADNLAPTLKSGKT